MGYARLDPRAGAPARGGSKKKEPPEQTPDACLGRSRGGYSTKIHAGIDALGNAVRLIATAGQAGDCPQALPLLEGLETERVIADTSYDSDENRAYCAQKQIEVVIPSHPNRKEEIPLDADWYADRNQIERYFNRMKRHRRLATRYEKTTISFLACWLIASALDWLR